jgi:hypothetical protein
MPSSIQRKSRRQCFGVNRKGNTFRWMGSRTVRVLLTRITERGSVVTSAAPKGLSGASCGLEPRATFPIKMIRQGRCEPPAFEVGSKPSIASRVRHCHLAQVKAEDGAEKSFLPRRRKRGLRRGKKRSRGGKPRSNAAPRRPSQPKPHNARRVNHSGRKFLWAVRAANRLANQRTAKRLIENIPRIPVEVQNEISSRSADRHRGDVLQSAAVRSFSRFRKSWRGVKRRADELGVHPTAAVSTSPWKFLAVRSSAGDWELLLAGLRPPEPHRQPGVYTEPSYNASGLGHFWITTRRGYVCSRCGNGLDMAVTVCPRSAEGLRLKKTSRGSKRGSGGRGARRDFGSLF